MNIQIFGTKKCNDTKKAEHFFKERGIKYQFIDMKEKEHREEKILDRMLLGQLLEKLDGQERTLIYLRYFAEKTQSAVGKEMGISQVQVSRMEKKIIQNLREMTH